MAKRKIVCLLVLFVFLGAAGTGITLLSRHAPSEIHMPPCSFHETTGLYCPGCGATRALRRALKGDIVGALRYNALYVILAPALAYLLVLFFIDKWRGYSPYRRGDRAIATACLILIVAFFVLRNVNLPCFDWMRPPPGVCP